MRRLFALALLTACTPPGGELPDAGMTDAATPDAATPDAGAGDAGTVALELRWSPCTLSTPTAEPAECAQVFVPLRWSEPAGPVISLSIKRYHPAGVTSRGQLWLLSGGPGASVDSLDGAGPYFARRGVALDFYMLDQRGTGASTRLGCADQESAASASGYAIADAEWPACLAALRAAWPNGQLDGFNVTETARDLGQLIAATRAPADQTFVYGLSYGTYLVNRYLQLYPDQPTGVVLDSVCSADECRTSRADARFNDVAHAYFTACGADAVCSAHLGVDPWARVGTTLAGLAQGSCAEATDAGFDVPAFRRASAQWLYDWDRRTLIPALVHRLARCGPQDEPVIRRLAQLIHAPAAASSVASFSTVLSNHISLSELWDEPGPSLSQLEAEEAAQYVSNGVAPRLAALHDGWPKVAHDAYWGRWATTSVPVLVLAGTLDPATPLAIQTGTRAAFAGAHQTFVEVPRAPHGVLLNSPVTVAGAAPCGTTLVVGFLGNPLAALDTSCTAQVQPLAFDRAAAAAPFFGTSDLWGD